MQSSLAEAPALDIADHLINVPFTDWAFWKWTGLRSAGFPAGGILKLAAPQLGPVADRAQEALRAKDEAFDKAVHQVNSALDHLKQTGRWEDKQRRAPLLKARRKLELKQLPASSPETEDLASIRELQTCFENAERANQSFEAEFHQCSTLTSRAIAEFAGNPRFREAIVWQNRKLVRMVLDTLRADPPQPGARNSRLRQYEEVVATYLQRYCVKNDSIGFFGPVGWGKFVAEGDAVRSAPGPELITARRTYWEAWPIEKIARVIAQNPGVLPWIPPIPMPFVRVEGETLHHPVLGPQRLTPAQAAVLRSCNGSDPANQIAEKMLQLPETPFKNAEEVYACLRDFAARRVVFWEIFIPSDAYPGEALRATLDRIGDPDARQSSFAIFEQIDAAKHSVESAAGDPEKLNASFDHLERVFTGLTAAEATRHPGKTYAGRTLVYEDCRRDLKISLGPELLKELAAPLSIVLAGARWITAEVREAYRKKVREVYSGLVASTGQTAIDVSLLWTRLRPAVIDSASTLTLPVQQEFHKRWSRVFSLDQQSGPITYSSDELRERVLAEFPPGDEGRIGARYHSPDIMIAAPSEEAIRRGEYTFVLGEMHLSTNTLASSLFVHQHPCPKELLTAVEHDLGPMNLVPVSPKNPDFGCRMENALIAPSNLRLEYSDNAFEVDRSRVVPVSSLVVEDVNGKLLAKTRDGRLELEAVDAIRPPLLAFVIDSFKMASGRSHSPRVSIDRLVIKRESWRYPAAKLAFSHESSSAHRYAQTRKWRLANAMPRFVFLSAPVEPKPCYLDFESPILVDIFCKIVRRTREAGTPDAAIEISEMLPRPDQIWLTDAEQNRYTSEFRIVAVDLRR